MPKKKLEIVYVKPETLKRVAFLMELDPCYVNVILDRAEKLMGIKAIKVV